VRQVSWFLIGASVLFAFWGAFNLPVMFDSAYYISQAKIALSPAAWLTNRGSHPLLVPAIYALTGRLGMPVLYCAFLTTLYYFFSRRIGPDLAPVFTAFFAGFPMTWLHSTQVYCELPLAFFFFSGVAWLYEYFHSDDPRHLAVALLFFVLAIYTKAAGLPLVCIALAALALHEWFERGQFRLPFLLTGLAAALAILPMVLSRSVVFLARSAEMNESSWGQMIAIPWMHGAVLLCFSSLTYFIFARLFTYLDWGLLWPAAIFLTAAFYWRGNNLRGKEKYLLFITLVCLATIWYIFKNPSMFRFLVDGTSIQRMIYPFAPVALYYVGILCARLFPDG